MAATTSVESMRAAQRGGASGRLREYFWSDPKRRLQTVLGLIWLLDGGLQFQAFMFTHGFPQSLVANAAGQPQWLHDSIIWGARIANGNLGVWNTLFALTQVLIGLGLLYRPLVRVALVANFGWVLVVWWFGEGFAMLLMNMAQPLTGAPGVLMYALVGLLAWPGEKPGGLLSAHGAKVMWASLWLVMAWLWLTAPSSDPNAVHDALTSVDGGIGWLTSVQTHLASAARGNGLVIAVILAFASAAIGIGVAAGWQARRLLSLSIAVNAVYWVVGQAFGGIFAGGATDPNVAPLFILLAAGMFPLLPHVGAQEARPALDGR